MFRFFTPLLTRLLALALMLLAMSAIHLARRRPSPPAAATDTPGVDIELARRLFPGAAAVAPAAGGTDWTPAFRGDGSPLGAVVNTSPLMDNVRGYAGPTPMLVGIDPGGSIVGVVNLDNAETPSFLNRVVSSGFLESWVGIGVDEALSLEVDAVSGATATAAAMAESIRGRLALAGAGEHSPAPVSGSIAAISLDWLDFIIFVVAAGGMAISLGWFPTRFRRRLPLARYVLMGMSLAFLGFAGARMLSMALLDGWAVAGRPFGGAGLVLLAAAALLFPVATGRNFYCCFACPFGVAQEFIFKISPFKSRMAAKLGSWWRLPRFLLLAAVAAAALAGWGLSPADQEPFSAFQWRAAGAAAILIAIASLALSLVVNRPWCSFFCSSGALIDLLRGRRLFREKSGRNPACPETDNGGNQT